MTLRYAEGEWRPWQEGRAAELEALALRLCDLVERDSAVYDKVVAAKAAGGAQALEKALREALETPLEMMEASLGGLRLTAAGAPQGLPAYLRCDCLAAARALATALEAAHLMIRENAGGVTRDAELEHLLAAADAVAAEARGLVQGLAGVLRLEPA
jgi:formiminotetrahydrofolate cyclodeaminase